MGEDKISIQELIPIYGTYKDYQRFRKNPNFKTGISLGLSTLGDISMLTGIGAVAKGVSMINKANKLMKTANVASKSIGKGLGNVSKFSKALKREKDAVHSLTLMEAPTNTIIDRTRKLNKAKQAYNNSLKIDANLREKIYNQYDQASKLIDNAPTMSKVAPFIFTNPSFHAASKAIQYNRKGGNILSLKRYFKI